MGFLDTLFGRGRATKAPADAGIQRTVRCNRCGALINLRIDSRNDLSLNDEGTAFFVRKTLVDSTCFTRIELELTFDLSRREVGCEVRGGTLAP